MNFNRIDKQLNLNQNGEGNTQTNIFTSQIQQLEKNPFKPQLPREGGIFGKEIELTTLHDLLQSGKNVCVVSGIGGVGKTELVRYYAASEDCKTHFSGEIFYIDVRSRDDIVADIVALTKYHFYADIQDDLSPQQKINACWDGWKRETDQVLLILDDVSSLAKNIKQYLPPSDLVNLRLLMTSRDTPNQRIAEKLFLEVLLPDAALALLASIIGEERVEAERKEAEKLCEELGYLPLALELVAYYLDDEDYQDLSLLKMRGKLKEKVKHPSLSPEDVPMSIKATRGIQAAFDLSWDEFTPEAKHLACVLGSFAAAAIHWEYITAIYESLQGESFSKDNLKDKWLKSLRKLHFVLTVEADIYDLHPLIRDYLGEQFKQHSEHNQIKQAFCDVFVNVAGNVEQSTTLAVFNLIEPYIKKMIVWCERNADTQFAFCLNQLALLYNFQGKYEDAESLYLQALEQKKRLLGNNHPDVANFLNNLAGLYKFQGKYKDAEPLYLQALTMYQQTLGNQHLHTQNALLGVKGLQMQMLLHCNTETLFSILQALAQQAELPAFNIEVALTMLELLESNPELLSQLRKLITS